MPRSVHTVVILFLVAATGLLYVNVLATSSAITTGVYIPGAAHDPALLDEFEARTGQPAGIVHWYQPWGADRSRGRWYQPELDVEALRAVAKRGAIPLITWEAWGIVNGSDPSQVRTIPTGVYNDYIDSWAVGLRDFSQPVYLRLFHELNNPVYPWAYGNSGNTDEHLIAAWRYVHNRFAMAGASNVSWVWAPATENRLVPFQTIYPGGDYVDWLGVDGYNGGDVYVDWWDGWASPNEVFSDSLRTLAALDRSKPVMIVEAASVEQGGNKAEWINQLYVTLPREFPQVRAILWFNAAWGEDERANWLIESSDASLAAYRATLDEIAPRTPTDITTSDRVAFGMLTAPAGRERLRHLFSLF